MASLPRGRQLGRTSAEQSALERTSSWVISDSTSGNLKGPTVVCPIPRRAHDPPAQSRERSSGQSTGQPSRGLGAHPSDISPHGSYASPAHTRKEHGALGGRERRVLQPIYQEESPSQSYDTAGEHHSFGGLGDRDEEERQERKRRRKEERRAEGQKELYRPDQGHGYRVEDVQANSQLPARTPPPPPRTGTPVTTGFARYPKSYAKAPSSESSHSAESEQTEDAIPRYPQKSTLQATRPRGGRDRHSGRHEADCDSDDTSPHRSRSANTPRNAAQPESTGMSPAPLSHTAAAALAKQTSRAKNLPHARSPFGSSLPRSSGLEEGVETQSVHGHAGSKATQQKPARQDILGREQASSSFRADSDRYVHRYAGSLTSNSASADPNAVQTGTSAEVDDFGDLEPDYGSEEGQRLLALLDSHLYAPLDLEYSHRDRPAASARNASTSLAKPRSAADKVTPSPVKRASYYIVAGLVEGSNEVSCNRSASRTRKRERPAEQGTNLPASSRSTVDTDDLTQPSSSKKKRSVATPIRRYLPDPSTDRFGHRAAHQASSLPQGAGRAAPSRSHGYAEVDSVEGTWVKGSTRGKSNGTQQPEASSPRAVPLHEVARDAVDALVTDNAVAGEAGTRHHSRSHVGLPSCGNNGEAVGSTTARTIVASPAEVEVNLEATPLAIETGPSIPSVRRHSVEAAEVTASGTRTGQPASLPATDSVNRAAATHTDICQRSIDSHPKPKWTTESSSYGYVEAGTLVIKDNKSFQRWLRAILFASASPGSQESLGSSSAEARAAVVTRYKLDTVTTIRLDDLPTFATCALVQELVETLWPDKPDARLFRNCKTIEFRLRAGVSLIRHLDRTWKLCQTAAMQNAPLGELEVSSGPNWADEEEYLFDCTDRRDKVSMKQVFTAAKQRGAKTALSRIARHASAFASLASPTKLSFATEYRYRLIPIFFASYVTRCPDLQRAYIENLTHFPVVMVPGIEHTFRMTVDQYPFTHQEAKIRYLVRDDNDSELDELQSDDEEDPSGSRIMRDKHKDTTRDALRTGSVAERYFEDVLAERERQCVEIKDIDGRVADKVSATRLRLVAPPIKEGASGTERTTKRRRKGTGCLRSGSR